MADRMTQAGRDWLNGTLSNAAYFAMARRAARPSLLDRLSGWWRRG